MLHRMVFLNRSGVPQVHRLGADNTYQLHHDPSELKFQRHVDDNIHKHGCRGYGGEILRLARKTLPQGVHIHDSFTEKFDNSNSWHITHERSLVGVDKSTLAHEPAISGRSKTTTLQHRLLRENELLQDACNHLDYCYLLLHQIYCLKYRLRGSENDLGRNVSQKGGLNVVSYRLVSNEHLAPESLQSFCIFPLPLDVLFAQSQAFRKVQGGLMRCLEKMADGWDNLKKHSRDQLQRL